MKEKWKNVILITTCVVACLPLLAFLWSFFTLYRTYKIHQDNGEIISFPRFDDTIKKKGML